MLASQDVSMALIIRSIRKAHELCLRTSYKSLKFAIPRKIFCHYSAIKCNGAQMTQINMINADDSKKSYLIIIISVISVLFF